MYYHCRKERSRFFANAQNDSKFAWNDSKLARNDSKLARNESLLTYYAAV